jgi:glycosyltransferase involved in cell wall biosynthesis
MADVVSSLLVGFTAKAHTLITGQQSLMTPQPVVSIILPTYNRLRFLPQAIESARAQTHADWEMIVVDDGSDDGTAEYLAGMAAADPRIRVVALPRTGRIPRLRNIAAAEARGTWLAFLDSDDFWHPAKLEKQLAATAATPGARWSYVRHVAVGENGEPQPLDAPRARPPRSGWILQAYLERRTVVSLPAVVVERELFHQVGGFDETFELAEDHDLWLRLAAAAPVAGLDEGLTLVRMHAAYEKCRRTLEDPRLRGLCRRNQAALSAALARRWYDQRRPLLALASALRSLRYRPRGADIWHLFGRPALKRLARELPWTRRERHTPRR